MFYLGCRNKKCPYCPSTGIQKDILTSPSPENNFNIRKVLMLKCHLVLLALNLFVSLTSIRLISIRLHDAMSLSLTCNLDFENILRNCKYGDNFWQTFLPELVVS